MNFVSFLDAHCAQLPKEAYDLAYDKALINLNRRNNCLISIYDASEVITMILPDEFWEAARQDPVYAELVHLAMANQLVYCAQWRLTKDIVRIDADVLKVIIDTPINGDLPVDVIFKLPSWCMFVEYPVDNFLGFFVGIERSPSDTEPELRFWWLKEDSTAMQAQLHLGNWTLEEAIQRSQDAIRRTIDERSFDIDASVVEASIDKKLMSEALNITLYLCAQNAEYDPSGSRPTLAYPANIKKGMRFLPAKKPRIWNVGQEVGKEIRRAMQTHHSKRSHIRRAHWHGFWSGPRDGEREFNLKWLPPILVGGE